MCNRKELREKLNKVNARYFELKTQMEKMHVPVVYLERLNKIRRELEAKLYSEFSDDLMKLNNGKKLKVG